MKITVLGSGANGGTPQLDCRCQNCELARKDGSLTRLRSSFLVETEDKRILVDCGPDFWHQMKKVDFKIQDLDLIVISHFHFDHSVGLNELSGGKKWNVPILVSKKNRKFLTEGSLSRLVERGFVSLMDEEAANKLGVFLVDVPHDPNFPTSGILIREKDKSVWFSTDVEGITPEMENSMKNVDLIIFDGTFMDESIFPASKLHHMTIEKSIRVLFKMGVKTIFSHINHSENTPEIKALTDKFHFSLADDGQRISV